jgi:hypothetical protein
MSRVLKTALLAYAPTLVTVLGAMTTPDTLARAQDIDPQAAPGTLDPTFGGGS